MSEKGQGNRSDYPPPPSRDKDEESLVEEHDENGTRVRRYEKSESADIQEPAVQVETKAGASWTEPEPQKPLGRKRAPKKVVVDTEPPVQVETKTPPTEADIGVEFMKTTLTASKRGVEIKPPQREEMEELLASHDVLASATTGEFLGLYPKDARGVTDYSEGAFLKLRSLLNSRRLNLKPTDADARAEIDSEIRSLMTEQRATVEARKNQNHEPMPAVIRSNRERSKSSEAIVMPPPGPEQLHEPIDFGKELKNIRSGTKEEQKQKLADFKEKLIEQKKGIAEIQKKLFEEVEKNPDAEIWEYLDLVKDLQEKHDLSDDQRFAIEKGLGAYSRTHQAIREKTEEYVDKETGKIDGSKLYEKLFNQKPKGRVEVILRPAVIYVRIEDLDDYAAAYNHSAVDQVTKEMKGEADSSGGCLLNNIPGLEGAVALEKATNGRFDKMDKYSNATLQHEEQHAFNKIINRGYNAEWERDLTNKDLGEIGIEDQVKDEISAFFKDGRSAEDIRRILLNPETIYKYGFEYKKGEKGDKEESEFSQKYVDLVEKGIQAYADLLEAGHSKEDAQALLFVEPLSKWTKTTERLLGEDKTEGTPKEWREKLRGLIMGATEKIGWYKSSEEKLIRRKEELRVEAEKIGGFEGFFRKMGEDYNKLGWKSKLAIGAALGLGAGISAAALVPEALVLCIGGIAVQRTAGLMSMYLKFEKASPPYGGEREKKFLQWGQREKAMSKAILYTTAMSLGIGYAVKEIGETEWANAAQEKFQHTVQGWLGNMLGHHAPAAVSGSTEAAPTPVPEPTASFTPGVTPTSEVTPTPTLEVTPTPTPDVVTTPEVSADTVPDFKLDHPLHAPVAEMPTVGASAHGYEGMMKDLFKHLPDTKPENIPDGSDLAKLYEAKANADPEAIGRAIHRIAMDPNHKFFTGEGSFRIDTGAHMTVDAHTGNILFNGEVQAPVNAHFTQTLPTEAPVAHVAEPLSTVTPAEAAEGIVIKEMPAEPSVVPAEMPPTPAPEVQPLSAKTVITPDTTVTTVNAPESINEPYVETPPVHAAETIAAQPPAPEATSIPETSTHPALGEVNPDFKVNALGLPVDISHANVYLDKLGNTICFGGSVGNCARKAFEIVAKDHSAVVYFDSTPRGLLDKLFGTNHLSKVFFADTGNEITPFGEPGAAININQPIIVDDTVDTTLKNFRIPTIDDLKELYKPGIKKP